MSDITYKYQDIANTYADSFKTTVPSVNLPKNMESVSATFNEDNTWVNLTWKEPSDTTDETGSVTCTVSGVLIVRKKDSAPTGINDGDIVLHVNRADFGSHVSTVYSDKSITFEDCVYYYGFFPYSLSDGEEIYNISASNITSVEYNVIEDALELYGFTFNSNVSSPSSNITYIEDNASYTSAKMNYSTDSFSYGDWEDAFFIKNCKPCMLKYDGTVDYYLDKDDYTLKENGTASDIASTSYAGNVMIEFPLVYYKIVDNGNDTYNFYFSNKQVDSTYKPWWSFYDANGNVIDHMYMAAYEGSYTGSTLRSISGTTNIYNESGATEISYANANNTNGGVSNIWDTGLYSDRQLINMLLMLIGKSTNTQATFGNGNVYRVAQSSSNDEISTNLLKSGTMNNKGLFWGSNSTTTHTGVKVFGMENYWGNQWQRIRGLIMNDGQKIKLTYGQQDGSTVNGYSTNGYGTGYISASEIIQVGTSGNCISKCSVGEYGIVPYEVNGSESTYECDGMWYSNSLTGYALVGGYCGYGLLCGAFAVALDCAMSITPWYIGASLSCKPLATT